uniref:Uncharacterized protein n=1 Tax=Meloidogyne incognita TaxID=6306 RepID=A0A914LD63_MELIC
MYHSCSVHFSNTHFDGCLSIFLAEAQKGSHPKSQIHFGHQRRELSKTISLTSTTSQNIQVFGSNNMSVLRRLIEESIPNCAAPKNLNISNKKQPMLCSTKRHSGTTIIPKKI